MRKKRSVGITIFGLAEIIMGTLGSVLFLVYLHATIVDIFFDSNYLIGLGELCYDLAVFFLPSPFLIWLGIGMLRLKPVARKGNLWLISVFFSIILAIFLLIFVNGLIYFVRTKEPNPNLSALAGIVISVVVFYPFISFLTRPKVKEQFK